MKQIVQNMTANEEYDENVTKRLNDAVNNLENLKVEVRYTSLSLLDVHSKTEQINTTLRKVNDGVTGISEQIANITRKVAFTVGVSSSDGSWNSGTLVFPHVVYNIGGGYDPNTGVFTAPVDGHFVFFVNVQSYSTNAIYVQLILNGSPKVIAMAETTGSSSNEAGPNLAVLRLQKGDRVWIKYYAGRGYFSYSNAPVTTFSGFLI
ncbi:complement C1q tumor necrosis factor-related protein 3-like isoform X2 [Ostrea edulis]|uniref:complement C1q tumor necrosis factor-related protein 3-like isoform X2 n=1 Tax=Ostrea edulis TaxID=37623 RepID=UPI0024AEED80|nr:complement C1q tumor necrosis factor-related protein 3-like isoform X2 [Ostrea edulis]